MKFHHPSGAWLATWGRSTLPAIGGLLLIGGVTNALAPRAVAQSIAPAPDGTETTITIDGNRIDISGGSRSGDGANLFHSFERFNLSPSEIANFLATPDLRNILGRVMGGDPSRIDGLIQISGGNPNLFLINPAGLIFGPNARLNVPAAFTATSATGVSFGELGDRWFNSFGSNNYATLIGDPNGLAFALAQPAAILNSANLSVAAGQNLSLIGGTVVSVGTLSAPGGRLTVAAVPGDRFVRLTPEGSVLALDLPIAGRSGLGPNANTLGPIAPHSIPELLAGQPVTANALTVRPDGTVSIGYSEGPVQPGDLAVQSANASTATLSAANNLILLSSQLSTTGDLNLLAGNAAIGRDNPTNPLRISAGGQLTLWGDQQIDLFGLHHPDSGFRSTSNLFVVSSGPITGNAPLQTSGQLFITTPTGDRPPFRTVYEPMFANRNGNSSLSFSDNPARVNRAPLITSPIVATTTTRPTITTTTTSPTLSTTRPTITTSPTTTSPTLSSTPIVLAPTATTTTNTSPTPLITATPIQISPTASAIAIAPTATSPTISNSTPFTFVPLTVTGPAPAASSSTDDRDKDKDPLLQQQSTTTSNSAPAVATAGLGATAIGPSSFTAPAPDPGTAWAIKQPAASAPWSNNVGKLVGTVSDQNAVGQGIGSSPFAGLSDGVNGVPAPGSAPGSAPLTPSENLGSTITARVTSSTILQQAGLSPAILNNSPPNSATVNVPPTAGINAPGAGLPVNSVPNSSVTVPVNATSLVVSVPANSVPNSIALNNVGNGGIQLPTNSPGLSNSSGGFSPSTVGASPISNPLGNPLGNSIGNPISNSVSNSVSNSIGNSVSNSVGIGVTQADLLNRRSSDSGAATEVATDPGQVLNLQALRTEAQEAIATCDTTVWLDCQRQTVARARSTGDVARLQRSLHQLGQAHYQAGEYGDAAQVYEEARSLATGHNNPVLEAIAESELGNVYGALGQFSEALAHYDRALTLARSHQLPLLESQVLNNLGLIATNRKDFAQAKRYQEQALAIARQQQDAASQARALTQLGLLHYQDTNYGAAVAAQREALALAEQADDRLAMTRILDNLGLAYYAQDDYAAAAASQTQALGLTRELGDRHAEARTLSNLGDTEYQLKRFDRSIEHLQQAIAAWEALRNNLTSDAARLAIFETQETTYSTLQTVLLAANQPERALEINERGRAQALLKLLAEDSRWTGRNSPAPRDRSAANEVEPIDLAGIRRVAREQSTTLVSYAIEREVRDVNGQRQLTDQAVNIWVVQPSGAVQFRQVKLPDSQTLRDQIPLLRIFLGTRTASRSASSVPGQNRRSITPGLRQLHRLLIDPIADLLPTRSGDRLIVMPQQDLFLVPFSALQDEQGRYLIERYSLAMAPSIQVLDRTQQQAQRLQQAGIRLGDRPLIVGNPTMPLLPSRGPNATRSQLAPLPSAEAEAEAVARLLKSEPLIGAAATKAAVLEQVEQASLIHLATHGILDAKHGLDSAIALAPSGDETNDGWLTARDLLSLKLNAQLVVLSACNTGQGAISGDGIIGLSRSLLAAGAPSAIVTQWAVPDAPTAFLMTRFYEFLGQGLDKAAALRQATLVTMQQYPDPIDWAAFTLIGDTD